MQVTVLGCTGSMSGPAAPSSGYLVQTPDGRALVMDLGSGVLGELQKHTDPAQCDILFTHAHPDHVVDFPGLLVWRRFHPHAPSTGVNVMAGPDDIDARLSRLCIATGDESDGDFSDTFAFRRVEPGVSFEVCGVSVTAYPMVHPVPAVGYRLEQDGMVIAYTGDTGWADSLLDLARDADVLLCEATWCDKTEGVPPDMHLSGYEAGKLASMAGVNKLVLTHIPPYGNPQGCLEAARSEFSGEIVLAEVGMVLGA